MAWYADVTVGTGKDHATLQAFEAAYDATDLTGTDGVIGRCTGIVTSATNYWTGYNAGLTATCRIVIQADTGQWTNGEDLGTGAEINHIQKCDNGATDPLWIEFNGLEISGNALSPIQCLTDAANSGYVITKCLFDSNDQITSYQIYVQGVGTTTVNVGGCVFRNNYAGSGYGSGINVIDGDLTLKVINSTFADIRYRGVYNSEAGASITLVNCAAVDCGGDWTGTDTETTCKSENDATLTDVENDDFVHADSFDLHIPNTSSALYQTGTAIADAWFTARCATDFDGTSWASPPSIGAFEYVAAASGRTTFNSTCGYLGTAYGMGLRMERYR